MRTLNQSGYWSQGSRPRKWVKVSYASGSHEGETILAYGSRAGLGYEDRLLSFSEITQRIDPAGGLAAVSGVDITGLIPDSRLTFCTEAEIAPYVEGATLGAGRALSAAEGSYADARNAIAADFSTPMIVVGRNYTAGSDVHTVYRGLVEFAVPADLDTCESAWLELSGQGLSLASGSFRIWLVEGDWTVLDLGVFRHFTGWAASGDYTLTDLAEEWTTAEYGTAVRIRLNAAGRAKVVAAAGSVLKLMLVSERDRDWTTYSGGASGPEYVMFGASDARLDLRYNSWNLDNQIVEIFYSLENAAGDLPSAINSSVCDLVWSGVVDSWTWDGRMLNLKCKQNDHKKNRTVPEKVITLSDWPNCPEANVGKAIPVVYGEFALSGEHRTGTGNFQGLGPGGALANWSYPNAFRGYVVSRADDARTVLFAAHYLKDYLPANLLFAWNSSTKSFEPFPVTATQVSDTKGHYRALILVWSDQLPNAFCEGKFRSVGTVLPTNYDNSGASNPSYAIDADSDTYAELTENDYIDFVFASSGGLDNGIVGFVMYAEFLGGAAAAQTHALLYKDERDTVGSSANWVEQSDDTPWSADGQVQFYVCEVDDATGFHRMPIQLGQYKLRIRKDDAAGTVRLYDLCAMVSHDQEDFTELFTHGKGRRDDALGSITGSGYALIENPSQVIEAFAENEMALSSSEIDLTALDTAATDLTGLKFAFQLVDQARARDLLDDLAAQAQCFAWWDHRDRLTLKKHDSTDYFPHSGTNVPAAKDTFTRDGDPSGGYFTSHPIMGEIELFAQEMNEVFNSFVVKYKRNMASGEFEGVLTCDKSACTAADADLDGTTGAALVALCDACYDRIQTVNTKTIELWAVRDETTAARKLQQAVEWMSVRRDGARFPAHISALECEFGDFYCIEHDRISERVGTAEAARKKWMVTGKDISLNDDLVKMELIEV